MASYRSSGVCLIVSCVCIFAAFNFITVNGRKHALELKNDIRNYIQLSSFGFFKNGLLEVQLKNFRFTPFNSSTVFGFSLDKTSNDAISPYLENHQERCVLEDEKRDLETMSVIFFTLDLNNKQPRLKISCSESMKTLLIQEKVSPTETTKRQHRAVVGKLEKLSDDFLLRHRRRRQVQPAQAGSSANTDELTTPTLNSGVTESEKQKTDSSHDNHKSDVDVAKDVSISSNDGSEKDKSLKDVKDKHDNSSSKDVTKKLDDKDATLESDVMFRLKQLGTPCSQVDPLPILKKKDGNGFFYELNFVVRIMDATEEGLYNLYFHNCPNYRHVLPPEGLTAINLTIDIVEMNDNDNYLSAGQMPLPAVYFFMSILFFLSGCFWIFILRKSSSNDVYKIHYLMALLVYVKSFSLTFHGINFHFIQSFGFHMEGWAVLYYITHLLKGALLFITIVLIGTGWALIKHIISDKEKKIFMIVIPLQVLANVAEIIMEESEEGDSAHNAWREVFILVDLLCCGAILFPVVWSIRHLQEASQTDGKAAINLKKLKLFRHFYIMIVCYIYFTRIIVYLLRITVPFKYEWLDEMFREMATLVFFVLTGYKFRPASNNPYLQLPQDDSEIEMDVVLTQSGAMDGVTKVGRNKIIMESEKNLSKQESSHEYD